jgi:hypothetical protein
MTSTHRRLAAIVVALATSACGSAPTLEPASAAADRDPCVVREADLDSRAERCLVTYDEAAVPSLDGLTVALADGPATIRSGAEATFTIELRNQTERAIHVPVPDGCLAWEATAWNADATTFSSECGGLCGSPTEMRRLTLQPGGVLRKHITLAATQTHIAGDGCEEQHLGPLPPGRYTLEIVLPWRQPDPEHPGSTRHRTYRAPLEVTP